MIDVIKNVHPLKFIFFNEKNKTETVKFQGVFFTENWLSGVKLMFSKMAAKIDEIFSLTLCSKCQINDEDFVNFCGLFRKHELYYAHCVEAKTLFA